MTLPDPSADGLRTAELFPSAGGPALEQLRQHYRHLTQILNATPALNPSTTTRGEESPETAIPVSADGVLTAARAFASAAGPLIDHLPVIIAALQDAADYRGDDGGWCTDCHQQPADGHCIEHVRDLAIAAAYDIATHAITG